MHALHLRSGAGPETVGCAVLELKRMVENKATGDSTKNEVTSIEVRL